MEKGRVHCFAADESENSEHAFHWYLDNYHQCADTVIFVHVYQVPILPPMGMMVGSLPMAEYCREMKEATALKTQALLSKYAKFCAEQKVNYSVTLEEDFHSPGYVICNVAERNNADAIIMGQRGLSAVQRILLGSTSDYVLHHAHSPVIIVPPPKV